jgi:hypothetical protein
VNREGREKSDMTRKGLLSLMLALCCVVTFSVRADDAAQIKTKLEAIRKAGEPTTGEELDKWYPEPPAGENAAPAIMRALAKMRLDGLSSAPTVPLLGKGTVPLPGVPMPPAMRTSISAVVANNREALELLHQALKIKQCRYPVDLRNGWDVKIPHLADVKRGAQLLELEALLSAEDGKTAKAVESMEDMLRLAVSLKNEPILLSQLVRIACNRLACTTLEWVLNRRPMPEEQLRTLTIAFKDAEDLESFRHELIGERANGIIIFQMPLGERKTMVEKGMTMVEKFVNEAGPDTSLPQGIWAQENWDADFDYFLASMDEIINGLAKGEKTLNELDIRFTGNRDAQRLVSGLTIPAIPHSAIRELDSVARMRVGQLAIGLERYRRAHHNQLPATLAGLVPEYLDTVPKDVFGDGSFVFNKVAPDGYRISSHGVEFNKPIAMGVK